LWKRGKKEKRGSSLIESEYYKKKERGANPSLVLGIGGRGGQDLPAREPGVEDESACSFCEQERGEGTREKGKRANRERGKGRGRDLGRKEGGRRGLFRDQRKWGGEEKRSVSVGEVGGRDIKIGRSKRGRRSRYFAMGGAEGDMLIFLGRGKKGCMTILKEWEKGRWCGLGQCKKERKSFDDDCMEPRGKWGGISGALKVEPKSLFS